LTQKAVLVSQKAERLFFLHHIDNQPIMKDKRTRQDLIKLLNRAMIQEEELSSRIQTLESDLAACRQELEDPAHELTTDALPASKVPFRIDFYRTSANSPIKGVIEHIQSREKQRFNGRGDKAIASFIGKYIQTTEEKSAPSKKQKNAPDAPQVEEVIEEPMVVVQAEIIETQPFVAEAVEQPQIEVVEQTEMVIEGEKIPTTITVTAESTIESTRNVTFEINFDTSRHRELLRRFAPDLLPDGERSDISTLQNTPRSTPTLPATNTRWEGVFDVVQNDATAHIGTITKTADFGLSVPVQSASSHIKPTITATNLENGYRFHIRAELPQQNAQNTLLIPIPGGQVQPGAYRLTLALTEDSNVLYKESRTVVVI
jgi:hypothetical protein